jgi:hypothetical protein
MNIADRVNSSAIKDNRLRSCEAHADMTLCRDMPPMSAYVCCIPMAKWRGRPCTYSLLRAIRASGVTTAFGQLSPVNQPRHARSYAFASSIVGACRVISPSQPRRKRFPEIASLASSYDHLSRYRDAQLPSPSPQFSSRPCPA